MTRRYRYKQVLLRLTEEEYDFVKNKQNNSKFKYMNDFIFECILNHQTITLDKNFMLSQSQNLSQIGNNINQIAKKVNEYNTIHKSEIQDLQKSITEIIEIFYKIIEYIKGV